MDGRAESRDTMNDQMLDAQMKRLLLDVLQFIGVDNLWMLSRMMLMGSGLLEWIASGIATFAQDFWLPGILKFISTQIYVQVTIIAFFFLILGLFANGVGARVQWVRPGGFLRWMAILYILVVAGGPVFGLLDEARRKAPGFILSAVPLPQIPVSAMTISADGAVYRPLDESNPVHAAQARIVAPLRDRNSDGSYDVTDIAMATWHATAADVYNGSEAFSIETTNGPVSIEGLPPAFRSLFFGGGDGSLPWYQSDFSTDPNGAQKRAEALTLGRVGTYQAFVGFIASASAFMVALIGFLFTLGTLALYVMFACFAPLGLFGTNGIFVGGIFKGWVWLCAWSIGVTVASRMLTVLLFGVPEALGIATKYPLSLVFCLFYLYLHVRLYKLSWYRIRSTVVPLSKMAVRGGRAELEDLPAEKDIEDRQKAMGFDDIDLAGGAQIGMKVATTHPVMAGNSALSGALHGASSGFGLYNLVSADMDAAQKARATHGTTAVVKKQAFTSAVETGQTVYGRLSFDSATAKPGPQDPARIVTGGTAEAGNLVQQGFAVRQHDSTHLQIWRPLQGTKGWGAGHMMPDAPEQARPLSRAQRGALIAGHAVGLTEAGMIGLAHAHGIATEAQHIGEFTPVQTGQVRQLVQGMTPSNARLVNEMTALVDSPSLSTQTESPPSLVTDAIVPAAMSPGMALRQSVTREGTIDSARLYPIMGAQAEQIAAMGERYGVQPVTRAVDAAHQAYAAIAANGTRYSQTAYNVAQGRIPASVSQAIMTASPELAVNTLQAAADRHIVSQVALGARAPLTIDTIADSVGTTITAGGDLQTLSTVSGVDARQFRNRATHVGQYLDWAKSHDIPPTDAAQMVRDRVQQGSVAETTAKSLAPTIRAQGVAILKDFPSADQWTIPLMDSAGHSFDHEGPITASTMRNERDADRESLSSPSDFHLEPDSSVSAEQESNVTDLTASFMLEQEETIDWIGNLTERINAPIDRAMAAVDTRAGAVMAQVDHGVDQVGVVFETAVADGADGAGVVLNNTSIHVDEGVDHVNDAFDAISNVKRPPVRREVTRPQQRVERRREDDIVRVPHQVTVTPQMERTAERRQRQSVPKDPQPSGHGSSPRKQRPPKKRTQES